MSVCCTDYLYSLSICLLPWFTLVQIYFSVLSICLLVWFCLLLICLILSLPDLPVCSPYSLLFLISLSSMSVGFIHFVSDLHVCPSPCSWSARLICLSICWHGLLSCTVWSVCQTDSFYSYIPDLPVRLLAWPGFWIRLIWSSVHLMNCVPLDFLAFAASLVHIGSLRVWNRFFSATFVRPLHNIPLFLCYTWSMYLFQGIFDIVESFFVSAFVVLLGLAALSIIYWIN